jgi:hypothetical protein
MICSFQQLLGRRGQLLRICCSSIASTNSAERTEIISSVMCMCDDEKAGSNLRVLCLLHCWCGELVARSSIVTRVTDSFHADRDWYPAMVAEVVISKEAR